MKKLVVMTIKKEDNIFLCSLLQEFIEENIEMIPLWESDLKMLLPINDEDVVVLISGKYLEKRAREVFPNSHIIVAKRIFSGNNLEKVILIPEGERVLVVNYPKEVAVETAKDLEQNGIKHLKFIPVTPDEEVDLHGINYMICCDYGLNRIHNIKTSVNIGKRTISLSTFYEILQALNLDKSNLNNFFKHYNLKYIQGSYKIADLFNESVGLRRNLEYIYKTNSDGIICIDEKQCINIINDAAKDILQLTDLCIGKKYKEEFDKSPKLIELLEAEKNKDNVVIDYKERKIALKIEFPETIPETKAIVILQEYNKLSNKELEIRKTIRNNGKKAIAKYHFNMIIGKSPSILNAIKTAKQYAQSDFSVLIQGDSGTGKELFAQSIHNHSRRAKAPFVGINIAGLPENLVESELLGYEEGAFTGAIKGGKPGLFEIAHGGTIFIDEIGDASLSVQTKILRVLEEKEVMRLGASYVRPIDVRVICATNKNMEQAVEEKQFRRDLFYRIKVLPLTLPSLHERGNDVLLLAEHIARELSLEFNITKKIEKLLLSYTWPGNIRELKSMIQYLSVISKEATNDTILYEDILKFLAIKKASKNDINYMRVKNKFEDGLEYYILSLLYNCRNTVIGRGGIIKKAWLDGYQVSEYRIKIVLKELEQKGFVEVGETKQGTHITEAGIDYLGEN